MLFEYDFRLYLENQIVFIVCYEDKSSLQNRFNCYDA